MPDYVLNRMYEIMQKEGLKDVSRVGLYGLTYKENVDDTVESPTLQMLESMDWYLSGNLVKIYDPFITEDMVHNQMQDLDEVLDSVDMLVLIVGRDEIKQIMENLKGKVVLNAMHICFNEETYRL